jgi:hypothetical protein
MSELIAKYNKSPIDIYFHLNKTDDFIPLNKYQEKISNNFNDISKNELNQLNQLNQLNDIERQNKLEKIIDYDKSHVLNNDKIFTISYMDNSCNKMIYQMDIVNKIYLIVKDDDLCYLKTNNTVYINLIFGGQMLEQIPFNILLFLNKICKKKITKLESTLDSNLIQIPIPIKYFFNTSKKNISMANKYDMSKINGIPLFLLYNHAFCISVTNTKNIDIMQLKIIGTTLTCGINPLTQIETSSSSGFTNCSNFYKINTIAISHEIFKLEYRTNQFYYNELSGLKLNLLVKFLIIAIYPTNVHNDFVSSCEINRIYLSLSDYNGNFKSPIIWTDDDIIKYMIPDTNIILFGISLCPELSTKKGIRKFYKQNNRIDGYGISFNNKIKYKLWFDTNIDLNRGNFIISITQVNVNVVRILSGMIGNAYSQ